MFSYSRKIILPAAFACGLFAACQSAPKEEVPQHNTLTEAEISEGWQLLFDGATTNGWHNYLKDSISGWTVVEGTLTTAGKNGDIVTDREFTDFELLVDWRITDQGNSGIFYYIVEDTLNKRMYESGPEFQIIDNHNYPQELMENQVTGSASDVLKPEMDATNPVGEWNSTRIVVKEGKAEHWLNGKKILSYDLNSEEWKKAVAESKFAELNYAKFLRGRIGLQDHGNFVAYRNIKIREL